ncbi:MAG: pyridoxal-phosphate dependent enzyme [Actinomycetota bacterium]|nr:pyridoxal-phosphate dependent enzyme [Actinomycetota bacterium]
MASVDRFPRLSLGRWPTPVRFLPQTSAVLGADVYAKIEDACSAWGGNKVRKLEYVLGRARAEGRSGVLTYGFEGSTWVAATALHARRAGFDVRLVLTEPIPDDHLRLYDHLDVTVHTARGTAGFPLAAARSRVAADRNTAVLPIGGSGGVGDVGSSGAGREIAEAVRLGHIPEPARVVVPAGTSGTAGGIAAGLALGGLRVPVVAVRVTPKPLGTRKLVLRRARNVLSLLDAEVALPPIIVEDRFLGAGYGRPTAAGARAMELARADDLELEPTYSAKAFAALIELARSGAGGPFLFLHTPPGPLAPVLPAV